jgi:hypothetical protein
MADLGDHITDRLAGDDLVADGELGGGHAINLLVERLGKAGQMPE